MKRVDALSEYIFNSKKNDARSMSSAKICYKNSDKLIRKKDIVIKN